MDRDFESLQTAAGGAISTFSLSRNGQKIDPLLNFSLIIFYVCECECEIKVEVQDTQHVQRKKLDKQYKRLFNNKLNEQWTDRSSELIDPVIQGQEKQE